MMGEGRSKPGKDWGGGHERVGVSWMRVGCSSGRMKQGCGRWASVAKARHEKKGSQDENDCH